MRIIKNTLSLSQKFSRDENGAIALLFGILAITFSLVVGLAIDFSRAATNKGKMNSLLDGTMLMTAQKYALDNSIDVQAEANKILAKTWNLPSVKLPDVKVIITEDEKLIGTIEGEMDTSFMRIGGTDKVALNVQSVVSADVPKLEVALVLDNTGSMGKEGKMASLKSAAKDLVDTLMKNDKNNKVKIAIVPFARYVNVGTGNLGESWLDGPATGTFGGCVTSRKSGKDVVEGDFGSVKAQGLSVDETIDPVNVSWGPECPQPITPLTDSQSKLESSINSMIADGYTYIPQGLAWGWRVLTTSDPFSEGSAKSENVNRVIIVMTDGANTIKPKLVGGKMVHEKSTSDSTVADNKTKTLCQNIKSDTDKIRIFSIAFKITDTNIKTLMRNCASKPGDYFDASNSSALKDAFDNISISLTNLRVAG